MGEARYTEGRDRLGVGGGFARRHIGPDEAERRAMLWALGLASTEALVAEVVPRAILSGEPLPLPEGRTEQEALAELRAIVAENEVHKSFIGAGYHGCHLPPVILRNLLENPAWYTAYTPYQAEVSQGRLEALLNFQTMIADLTGMEIANASLLDEGTAAAEAMAFCRRLSKSKGPVFFASEACHPQTVDVVRTRAAPLGIEVVVGDHRRDLSGLDVFGVLLQYPASTGEIFDYGEIVAAAHARGALVTVAADPLSLALLAPPGAFGADVAVGTVQRFGLPMGYGGPHAAYFATREAYRRAIPGRLVGVSVDRDGRTAYRLALQAREQHVRRERATSNICTAPVLPAVIAGMYAAWHGPEGLRAIARRVHRLTAVLAEGLRRLGCAVPTGSFFDTITVRTGERTARVHAAARAAGINLREVDALTVGVSLDETTTPADVDALWRILAAPGAAVPPVALVEAAAADRIPAGLARRGDLLAHPAFHRHRSETEMLRYLRGLADKDLALDRTMIPLGSCTMKLNATAAMIPLTWEGLSGLHPFAPPDQARGYRRVIADLEAWLAAITGYDAVSLQPNAGSQGEYAGLLVVRAWHESRGEGHRDVCLIPASAHGSNPASAAMAGMRVVVVACDGAGNVDVADLRAKAERHADRLAALMITYPSTHGVFEAAVEEICEVVHRHGGQVYVDGANMNAMVGLCRPGRFGDVSHLNLHKTFSLPHGGGGPGVGPIAVRRHLAPFLPGHRHAADGGAAARPGAIGPVASAPWGSAGLLAIAWMYIAMMGRDGLRAATEAAILNANYIARRLAPHYPTLYTGPNGMVAHECILDLRPLRRAAGVTVEDVAKRLIDYGFHAPSVSFPVAGTLMVEPTESEGKAELDRFCAAMIAIREEIRAVEAGAMDARDNPLKNAPHTATDLVAEPWPHPYTRVQAVFPAGPAGPAERVKYWPPVARVDNAHGDRNLVCACPPLSDYAEAA